MKVTEKYTYRVSWSEEDQEHVGLCAEFPSLSWLAKTKEKALSGVSSLVENVLKDLVANKEEIPEPLSTKKYSGKFLVRIPPQIHRKLDIEAHESKISLNRLISSKLAG